ncbi:MAG: 8-amino-7-oxononanoate synthase [Balneolaceae bacterium]
MSNIDRHLGYLDPLKVREEKRQLRTLIPVTVNQSNSRAILEIEGKPFLNFCSNDYLGLAGHPSMIQRSVRYTRKYGTGSSASRLISGSLDIHHRAEEKIASTCGREAALFFSTGFQANATLLPALTDRNDLILADKHCHNSLIQGGSLSRAPFRRFRHNDTAHLESLLEKARKKNKDTSGRTWVVTESLFSMDGDFAPLEKMIGICKKYNALFYVDDAHAFGVLGEKGMGLAWGKPEIDLVVGTLGKAAGGFGAFVLTSQTIYNYLVNYCSGFIYSTSPPPGVIGSAEAAMELIPQMEDERNYLLKSVSYTVDALEQAGFKTGGSRSHIIPVILNDERTALAYAEELYKNHIFVQAVRPPTVQKSRLRITLTSAHTENHLNKLINALKDVKHRN